MKKGRESIDDRGRGVFDKKGFLLARDIVDEGECLRKKGSAVQRDEWS